MVKFGASVLLLTKFSPALEMIDCPIAAVMIHVAAIGEGIEWYQSAFPESIRSTVAGCDFEILTIGGIQLEIVLADEKVASGPSGTVIYWKVPELTSALSRMQRIGAKLYRGPMEIEDGLNICQVQDPWGNCLGLRGPVNVSVSKEGESLCPKLARLCDDDGTQLPNNEERSWCP